MLGHNHQYMIYPSDIMISQSVEAKQLSYPPKWQPIMISLTRVTLGWTPNKRWLITKPDKLPRMHPPNQRLGKPDKLSQGAHSQTSYPRVQQKTPWIKGAAGPQLRERKEKENKRRTWGM